MALTLTRDSNLVKRYSEAIGWLVECSSTGAWVTDAAWTTMPRMSAPKIKPNEETAELKDGSGATIYQSATLDSYEFTVDLLQADKNTMDLAEYARDKYFMLLYLVGTVGDKQQIQVFAPGNISSTSEADYSDFVKVGFTFKSTRNDSAITISTLPSYITSAITQAVIPANKQRIIIEA